MVEWGVWKFFLRKVMEMQEYGFGWWWRGETCAKPGD